MPLLGKPLAVVSDARIAGNGAEQIVERLLSISGEDMLTVDRKYQRAWTGKLPTRFLVLSNELPRFGDASGAIAGRFIVLTMNRSWLGRENAALTRILLGELPGILNWALDGFDRLTKNGALTSPQSSADAIVTLHDLASPISAFIRDKCEPGTGEVSVTDLFAAWRDWAEANGHRPGNSATLGRNLRAVVPMVHTSQPRQEDGGRERRYIGMTLRSSHNGEGSRATACQPAENESWHAVARDPALLSREHETGTCAVCGQPMTITEACQTTHPNCEPNVPEPVAQPPTPPAIPTPRPSPSGFRSGQLSPYRD